MRDLENPLKEGLVCKNRLIGDYFDLSKMPEDITIDLDRKLKKKLVRCAKDVEQLGDSNRDIKTFLNNALKHAVNVLTDLVKETRQPESNESGVRDFCLLVTQIRFVVH